MLLEFYEFGYVSGKSNRIFQEFSLFHLIQTRFSQSTHLLMELSYGSDRPGKLSYNFSISNDLT